MDYNNGFTYRYIEKQTRCDICYQNKNEFLSCNLCIFFVCPTCFNKINFYETSKCPQCRKYQLQKPLTY